MAPRMKYLPDEDRECPQCERLLAADAFHAKSRNEDGSIRTRQTYCKECVRERQRERNGAEPRKPPMSPEERRAQRRAYYYEVAADPVRAERRRENKREYQERRRKQAKVDQSVADAIRATAKRYRDRVRNDPDAWRDRLAEQRIRYRGENAPSRFWSTANGAWTGGAHIEEIVDTTPFVEFLDAVYPDASSEQLESIFGIPSTRFRELRRGKGNVSLDLIDRAFTIGLGRPDLVAALYPLEGNA